MRLAAYVGTSAVLAVSVILRAFNERPNFYSACVYLAQSNACRMILLNLLLIIASGFMFGLVRLLYGHLRPIEVEQLWDKAWYAITETALAMTIFRDEVGGWFFVMFVSLLAGKVWGWISEGRVEVLEQQPPANPKLFHARLTTSLLVSEIFDISMLQYCATTLLLSPKPGMMVMFAFEFAVLVITSSSTTCRYLLSVYEGLVIRHQTRLKIQERREEIRAAHEEASRQAVQTSDSSGDSRELPLVEDIDETDVDVPGWQEKGKYILFLDLVTDFLKLLVYMCFFSILLAFHGIPIHIIRDVFITTRSFLKRLSDFAKYRNATRDMNTRYPDATAEELSRDGTCIICREDMRPWQETNAPNIPEGRARTIMDDRQRPKKLPCGHILHFGCLRSWLERQQVCPTCRSSVLLPPRSNPQPGNNANRPRTDANAAGNHPGDRQRQNPPNAQPQAPPDVRARTFNLGPYRFTFAAGNSAQVQNMLQGIRQGDPANPANPANPSRPAHITEEPNHQHLGGPDAADLSLQAQFDNIERQISSSISTLSAAQERLEVLRSLQNELARLQGINRVNSNGGQSLQSVSVIPQHFSVGSPSNPMRSGASGPYYTPNQVLPQQHALIPGQSVQQAISGGPLQGPSSYNESDLPTGMTLPDGWSLLPLQPISSQVRQDNLGPVEELLPSTGAIPHNQSRTEQVHPAPEQHPLTNVRQESQTAPAETVPEINKTSQASLGREAPEQASRTMVDGHARNTKGKSKAATVEDVEDEDDVE